MEGAAIFSVITQFRRDRSALLIIYITTIVLKISPLRGIFFFAKIRKNFEVIELEKIVGELLREKNLKISCAESCTGGLLTSKLTDIAGSSAYVEGSIISYSNEIKNKILHVKAETLKNFGAVSEETAKEMSANVREIFATDIGVSITGIAGPGGGTLNKPVGTVYISVATQEKIFVEKFNFSGTRIEIKNKSAQAALKMLEQILKI